MAEEREAASRYQLQSASSLYNSLVPCEQQGTGLHAVFSTAVRACGAAEPHLGEPVFAQFDAKREPSAYLAVVTQRHVTFTPLAAKGPVAPRAQKLSRDDSRAAARKAERCAELAAVTGRAEVARETRQSEELTRCGNTPTTTTLRSDDAAATPVRQSWSFRKKTLATPKTAAAVDARSSVGARVCVSRRARFERGPLCLCILCARRRGSRLSGGRRGRARTWSRPPRRDNGRGRRTRPSRLSSPRSWPFGGQRPT